MSEFFNDEEVITIVSKDTINEIFNSAKYGPVTMEELCEKVHDIVTTKIEHASIMGSIVIPRGLSDEQVLKAYHDPETNELEDTKQLSKIAEDAMMEACSALGLPKPKWGTVDGAGYLVVCCF